MKLTLKKISPVLSKSLGMPSSSLEDCFMPATEDDFEEIVNLRKVLFQDGDLWDDSKYLRWRFNFSDPYNDKKNHIWVFKYNEEILGMIGSTHIQLMLKGETISAHHATDILVRSDYNGSGLGGWLALALTEKMPILIATGANENSRSMMSRLYQPVPVWQVWKLPLSVSVLLVKTIPGLPKFVINTLSIPIDLLLKTRRRLKSIRKPTGFDMRELEQVPSEINGFEPDNQDIHIMRTQDFLNWRYLENPRIEYTLLGMYIKDELIGMSVSRLFMVLPDNQKHACIFEWIAKSNGYKRLVIDATNDFLIGKGAKIIRAIAYGEQAYSDFSSLGFIQREEEDCIYVRSIDANTQLRLSRAEDWTLTAGDSDSDLL